MDSSENAAFIADSNAMHASEGYDCVIAHVCEIERGSWLRKVFCEYAEYVCMHKSWLLLLFFQKGSVSKKRYFSLPLGLLESVWQITQDGGRYRGRRERKRAKYILIKYPPAHYSERKKGKKK